MNTTVINGIELKKMGDGTVEVYADRPGIVRIEDLIEVLTSSSETLVAWKTDCHFQR
jgi:ribosome maturation factor RimP